MRILIPLFLFVLSMISREKESGNGIEIYILDDYKTVSGSKEIISGSEKLEKNPNIYYNQINYYDSTDHILNLSSNKADELNQPDWSIRGKPFSLTA